VKFQGAESLRVSAIIRPRSSLTVREPPFAARAMLKPSSTPRITAMWPCHTPSTWALKPNRCPRNQECESHYKPVRIDAGEHFRCICHAGEVRPDVNRVGRKQGHDENTQQPLWKIDFKAAGALCSRPICNAGEHPSDLNPPIVNPGWF
jgi:hypothetical protein